MACPFNHQTTNFEASFDKHLFELHGAISKESTRKWKKVLKEGSQVERLKQEKNNILDG
jgi:hypothetical protein